LISDERDILCHDVNLLVPVCAKVTSL